jgi:hypothetical protein
MHAGGPGPAVLEESGTWLALFVLALHACLLTPATGWWVDEVDRCNAALASGFLMDKVAGTK